MYLGEITYFEDSDMEIGEDTDEEEGVPTMNIRNDTDTDVNNTDSPVRSERIPRK